MALYTEEEYRKLKRSGMLPNVAAQAKYSQPASTPTTSVSTSPTVQAKEYGILPFIKNLGKGVVDAGYRTAITPIQGVLEGANSFTTMAQRPGGLNEAKYNTILQNAINKRGVGLTAEEQQAINFDKYTNSKSYEDSKGNVRATPTFMRKSDMERYSDENPLLVGGKQALETGSLFLPSAKIGGAAMATKAALPIAGAMSGIGSTRANANPEEYAINAGVGAGTGLIAGGASKLLGKLFGKTAATTADDAVNATKAATNKISTSGNKTAPFKMPGEAENANMQVQKIIEQYKNIPELKDFVPSPFRKNITEQNYRFLEEVNKYLRNQTPEVVSNINSTSPLDDILTKLKQSLQAEDATLFQNDAPIGAAKNALDRLNSQNYLGKYANGQLGAAEKYELRKAVDSLITQPEFNRVDAAGNAILAPETRVFKTLRDILSNDLKSASPEYKQSMDIQSFISKLKQHGIPGKAITEANKQNLKIPNTGVSAFNVGDAIDRGKIIVSDIGETVKQIPAPSSRLQTILPGISANAVTQSISKPFVSDITNTPEAATPTDLTQTEQSIVEEALRTGYLPKSAMGKMSETTTAPQDDLKQKMLADFVAIADYYDNLTGPRGGDQYSWEEAQQRAYTDLLMQNPEQINILNETKSLINGESSAAGKILPATQLTAIADMKQGIKQMGTAIEGIKNGSGIYDPIWGRIRKANPWDTEAQLEDGANRLLRQMIGKGLEGGVLRKEDETKYLEMLPKITDTKEVAAGKAEQIARELNSKLELYLQTLEEGGYAPLNGQSMNEETIFQNTLNNYGY